MTDHRKNIFDAFRSRTEDVRTELVGKVVRVTGLRGRFAVHAVEDGTVTCWGGPKGREAWRAFPLERIGRVDREATRRREEA